MSPEEVIFREVQDIIDGMHALEAEHTLGKGGRSAISLVFCCRKWDARLWSIGILQGL